MKLLILSIGITLAVAMIALGVFCLFGLGFKVIAGTMTIPIGMLWAIGTTGGSGFATTMALAVAGDNF